MTVTEYKQYFFVITIETDGGSVSLASILNAGPKSTAQARYEAAYRAVCERTRAKKFYVPDNAAVIFYSCEPN